MPLTREDLKELPALLQEDPDLQLEVARAVLTEGTVSRLMRSDPELRDALRRAVLTDELLQLPEKVEQMDRFMREHAKKTDARLSNAETRLSNIEKTVEEVKQTQQTILTDVEQIKQEVNRLSNWQRGEDGRREGERYEARILKNAAAIFGLGEGGSPGISETVQRKLITVLSQANINYLALEEESSPFLADIIWWKGDRFALAEVSLKVNGSDVRRAKRRAETLRQGGVEVLPVVIGSEWAHPETHDLAQQEGVAWRISNHYSPELIEFHRYRADS
ncbi:MAG: hypothetical protein NZM28_03505 [Fimbriimonadales bacterium]|nr:hypothetical protein [Fimbriimonadales bacterium]